MLPDTGLRGGSHSGTHRSRWPCGRQRACDTPCGIALCDDGRVAAISDGTQRAILFVPLEPGARGAWQLIEAVDIDTGNRFKPPRSGAELSARSDMHDGLWAWSGIGIDQKTNDISVTLASVDTEQVTSTLNEVFYLL